MPENHGVNSETNIALYFLTPAFHLLIHSHQVIRVILQVKPLNKKK